MRLFASHRLNTFTCMSHPRRQGDLIRSRALQRSTYLLVAFYSCVIQRIYTQRRIKAHQLSRGDAEILGAKESDAVPRQQGSVSAAGAVLADGGQLMSARPRTSISGFELGTTSVP